MNAIPVALRVTSLAVAYRGVHAVRDVSLEVADTTCVAILGANGAGKTSILRGISGLAQTSRKSEVWLAGARVDRLPPERRARRGLGHVLENRHIFPGLSVRENLELGQIAAGGARSVGKLDTVFALFPELEIIQSRPAGWLSGGQQQFLAIGRAIMGNPTVLLLDEPTVGLAPQLIDRVITVVGRLIELGTSVLLVEQTIEVVRSVAGIVHVLSHGEIKATTTGNDPELTAIAHRVYLS